MSGWDSSATGRQAFRSPVIDWDACYVYIAWGHDRSQPLLFASTDSAKKTRCPGE